MPEKSPAISVLSPEQNKTYATSNVALAFTTDKPVVELSYSLDGQANVTLTGNATLTGMSDGAHDIAVYASDAAGNTGASERVYFTVGVPPIISVLSPADKTYGSANIALTFTVSEPVSWIGYSLDAQSNVTLVGNLTLPELSFGLHNITVYATDLFGNTGTSETVNFTINQKAEPETKQSEPFPTTYVIVAVVIVAVVGAGLLFYFKKRRH